VNGGGHLTLLAETDAGYANLCRLITLARRDQPKGIAALPWRWLVDHSRGLIALSGCRRSEIARALADRDMARAQRVAEQLAAIFGRDHFFLELQRHHERGDRRLNTGLSELGRRSGLRLVATGDVHYLEPGQAPLHDLLTCIRHRTSLEQAGGLLRGNAEYTFRSPAEMAVLFAEWPDALRATVEIAERCHARLPAGPQPLPAVSIPGGVSSLACLRHLCQEGLQHKSVRRPAAADYEATLDRELSIIANQGLVDYFLKVWDLVRFARSQEILCQGRGSAANSLVAYLLDITPIDPLAAAPADQLLPPGLAHPLGTDLLGMLDGYAGGWPDRLLMRIVDVLLAFPSLLLTLTIMAVLGTGLLSAAVAVGLAGAARFARLMRAAVLAVRSQPYIQAARVVGCRPGRILWRHVLPNASGTLIVLSSLELGYALLNISALGFLGLGAQPPAPEWGTMLAEGRGLLRDAPWAADAPGLAITLSVLAVNLLGDAWREALDAAGR